MHRSNSIESYADVIDKDLTTLKGKIMILSVFFDREAGGEETSKFIEDL